MDALEFEVQSPAFFVAMLVDGSSEFLPIFDRARDPVALCGFEKRETVAQALHVRRRLAEPGRSFHACHGTNASLDRIRVQRYARIKLFRSCGGKGQTCATRELQLNRNLRNLTFRRNA